MTQIIWGETGTHRFSVGVDRGVLFLQNGRGIPWNGLVSVKETPSGSDVIENYIDGQKFFSRRSPEEYSATIEAFTYPLEFEEYDGIGQYATGQRRKSFGFSYRTLIGNDADGIDSGYLLHLVYDATTLPVTRKNLTVASSADPNLFSWVVTTTPREFAGNTGSHLVIDSTIAYPWVMDAIEDMLYGSSVSDPKLPSPQEVLGLFEESSILKITDHGDGTWTAEGPDSAITMLDSTVFEITWPSALYIDGVTYKISSL